MVVVGTLGEDAASDLHSACQIGLSRRVIQGCLGLRQPLLSLCRINYLRPPKNNNRRSDSMLYEKQLRFWQLQLQTNRSELLSPEERAGRISDLKAGSQTEVV